MPDPTAGDDRDYVNSLARGLGVLRAFDREHAAMTLSEVAARADMNRAAARRFLLTLVREGYLATDGKRFRLQPEVLELGYAALASMSFGELAQPVLDTLAAELGELCLIATMDGRDVAYVARSQPQGLLTIAIGVGDRLPAFCMSTGRVLLAALDDEALDVWLRDFRPEPLTPSTVPTVERLRAAIESARAAGYAIVDQEFELGFRSVSVPVRAATGEVVAALNVCCPSARVSLPAIRQQLVPAMSAAATRLQPLLPDDAAHRPAALLRRALAERV